MKQIKFLTSNQIKISIASEILNKYDITVKQQSFPFKELQSSNIIAVAMDKADQALIGKVGGDFIIDDSGMYVECLNGFPGAMLKEVSKLLGGDMFIKLMEGQKNRKARYINVLVFADASGKKRSFSTVTHGNISNELKGDRKIGWAVERYFIPEGYNKTLAEFSQEEWDTFFISFTKRLHYAKFGKWYNTI